MATVKYDCGHEIQVEIKGEPGKEHISYPDFCPTCVAACEVNTRKEGDNG